MECMVGRSRCRGGTSVPSALLVALALATGGCGKAAPPPLEQKGMVNDFAGVLSQETVGTLSAELERFERETCHRIVVLVVPSLRGEPVKELSTRTALAWEVAHPVLKNGILLSVAIEEGQVRIESGTAFQGLVEQGEGDRILKQEMFPAFRDGDFDAGVASGVRALQRAARQLEIPGELRPPICRGD